MASEEADTVSPLAVRDRALADLTAEHWDLVVIGGGIVGCGVLLDAASRGLKAALVEQRDLAVGTSSRSSRLIHGGLRYLEDMRLHLVREALAERSRLLRLAPHLVRLERFLFPIYGWPVLHRAFYGAGLALYDLLGASRDAGRAHHLAPDAVAALAPSIRRKGLAGGVTYHDGVEDDARYTIAVARTAMASGATVLTRVRATGLKTAADTRIVGLLAQDSLTGSELDITADRVVDATGVWSGRPETRLGDSALSLVPSRGSHLVVPRSHLPLQAGMTLRIPGRVLFIVPWPDAWIIGTTDVADDGPPDRPTPSRSEIDDIIGMVNDVLDVGLTRDDAIGAYAGLRPLVGVPGGDTVRVSREHKVHREASGLVRVSGGKYTTYRLMARDAVDVALEGASARPVSGTATLQLVGAAARPGLDHLSRSLSQRGLEPMLATRLVDRYGSEAPDVLELGERLDLVRPLAHDVHHLEAEVVWAARRELALDLDDVLSRRMRLSMARRDRCASIAPRVAEILGAELGWDGGRQRQEVEGYLETARREYDLPAGGRQSAEGA